MLFYFWCLPLPQIPSSWPGIWRGWTISWWMRQPGTWGERLAIFSLSSSHRSPSLSLLYFLLTPSSAIPFSISDWEGWQGVNIQMRKEWNDGRRGRKERNDWEGIVIISPSYHPHIWSLHSLAFTRFRCNWKGMEIWGWDGVVLPSFTCYLLTHRRSLSSGECMCDLKNANDVKGREWAYFSFHCLSCS